MSVETAEVLPEVGSKEWRKLPMETKFPDHVEPTFAPLADPSKMWGINAPNRAYVMAHERRAMEDVFRIFLSMKSAPPTLWGPPGSRKTRWIEALSNEVDENGTPYQVITIQPSKEDPTIIHGIKYTSIDVKSGETLMKSSIPDVVMQIINYWLDFHGLTILFMDEMTTCMPAQQNALLGTMTHSNFGGVSISRYSATAMAANPENTVSTVHPLTEAVMNRGAHIPWYGDPQLFLEEWRTGFNHAVPSPSAEENWAMSALMEEMGSKVFRGNPDTGMNWTPETLVPYDQFSNSERSMTEWNRAFSLTSSIFKDAKPEVRKAYIYLVTRAILGPDGADAMQNVLARQDDLIPPEALSDQVRDAHVDRDWDSSQLSNAMPDFLNVGTNKQKLRLDQLHHISICLVENIKERAQEGELDELSLLTLWSMIQLVDSHDRMAMHLHILGAMLVVLKLIMGGHIPRDSSKVPTFVAEEIKNDVKPALVRLAASMRPIAP